MAELPEHEILERTRLVMEHHGGSAIYHASLIAAELIYAGDVAGVQTWCGVIRAIEKLQAMEPKGPVN